MGKTGRWLKGILTGGKKKDKDKEKDAATVTVTATGSNNTKEKEKDRELRSAHYHAMMFESKSGPLPSTAVPREKRRWSFRRSSGAARELNFPSAAPTATSGLPRNRLAELERQHWNHQDRPVSALSTAAAFSSSSGLLPRNRSVPENQEKQHHRTEHLHHHGRFVASATTAAAEAAIAAGQAPALAVQLSAGRRARHGRTAIENVAAIKIQAVFRGHLARKALKALRGLVKLQALIRGHIVRKQAAAALHCMHTLVSVQERARAQRNHHHTEEAHARTLRQANRRSPSPQNRRFRQTYEMDRNPEENIKIVEMDLGIKGSWTRNSHPARYSHIAGHRFPLHDVGHAPSNVDIHYDIWSAASGLTDLSPRTSSGRYEDISYKAIQSSPEYISAISKVDFVEERISTSHKDEEYQTSHEYSFYPNYMANTESSKAKARSQSAPKQRPDTYERQTIKRKPPFAESKSTPRGIRMQRSSSQVGPAHNSHQYPWSIKLDKSSTSLKDSECGSSSTVTNTEYCRPLVTHVVRGGRY